MKVKIYGLFDPRTYLPFYIGCTHVAINNRLSWHITNSKKSRTGHPKDLLIAEILELGLRPFAMLIEEVDFYDANEKEKKYYEYYTSMGIKLLQAPFFFDYTTRMLNTIKKSDPLEIKLRHATRIPA